MKIINMRHIANTLNELEAGTIFEFNSELYIKIVGLYELGGQYVNAINLNTFYHDAFDESEIVIPVIAELTVK